MQLTNVQICSVQLGTYTVTNTLVSGRNSWVSDTDPNFVISWCGKEPVIEYNMSLPIIIIAKPRLLCSKLVEQKFIYISVFKIVARYKLFDHFILAKKYEVAKLLYLFYYTSNYQLQNLHFIFFILKILANVFCMEICSI